MTEVIELYSNSRKGYQSEILVNSENRDLKTFWRVTRTKEEVTHLEIEDGAAVWYDKNGPVVRLALNSADNNASHVYVSWSSKKHNNAPQPYWNFTCYVFVTPAGYDGPEPVLPSPEVYCPEGVDRCGYKHSAKVQCLHPEGHKGNHDFLREGAIVSRDQLGNDQEFNLVSYNIPLHCKQCNQISLTPSKIANIRKSICHNCEKWNDLAKKKQYVMIDDALCRYSKRTSYSKEPNYLITLDNGEKIVASDLEYKFKVPEFYQAAFTRRGTVQRRLRW